MPDSIECLHVSGLHAYYGESHVLHGVDLTVRTGEVVTLLGRNGAGRTTTLKSILGLVRHRVGSVVVYGREAIDMAPYKVARLGVGYCPEERGIYSSLTVTENLLLPPVLAREGLTLDQIYEMFPNLYERRGSIGTHLSGGEQQMLAMARILRTGARLLLLDEITEGLAPVIVKRLAEVIRQLRERGYTMVMVEQNFHFASRLADRHYLMVDGHMQDVIDKTELEANRDKLNRYLSV